MKKMKKMIALVLSMVMVLAMSSLTAFAAGTNSITVTGAQNGETYNIYRMLDLSVGYNDSNVVNAYRYTINAKWKEFWTTGAGKDYVETNTAGTDTYVVWLDTKKDAESMEAFGKAASEWASNNSITADETAVIAENGTAKWEGLDNGYYLVTSTYGIAASVASTPTEPAQVIREKNNENTTEKKVLEDSTSSFGESNDAQIGDTITFRSKVTIAKNSINVVYHDTMDDGLTFLGVNNVKVYTDEKCESELDSSYYTVGTGADGETFTVTFNDDYVAALTATTTDVYVKYSAVLNDNIVVATAETNTGIVKWGNNGVSASTTTQTNTHRFTLLKYDGTDSDKSPLAGAEFKLYTTETSGTPLQLAKNNNGTIYRVVDMSDSGETLPTGYTLTDKIVTLDSNTITIDGVDSDSYWLEEIKAPKGYNLLTNRVKVEVDENNNLVSEIANNSGTTLPETGGMGTTIFYVVGGILVACAVILLVTKRRMNTK